MSKNPLAKAVTLEELKAIKARGEALGGTLLDDINQLAAAGHPLFIQVTVPSAVLKDGEGDDAGVALMIANTSVNVSAADLNEAVERDDSVGMSARLLGATTTVPFIVAHALNRAVSAGDTEIVDTIMELSNLLREYLSSEGKHSEEFKKALH